MRFAVTAAAPYRSHGVNDIARGQSITLGQFGLTGGATAQAPAFLQQSAPRGAMDGAVHAAAAQQRIIGGIDDGIHSQLGDVRLHYLDAIIHTPFLMGNRLGFSLTPSGVDMLHNQQQQLPDIDQTHSLSEPGMVGVIPGDDFEPVNRGV